MFKFHGCNGSSDNHANISFDQFTGTKVELIVGKMVLAALINIWRGWFSHQPNLRKIKFESCKYLGYEAIILDS